MHWTSIYRMKWLFLSTLSRFQLIIHKPLVTYNNVIRIGNNFTDAKKQVKSNHCMSLSYPNCMIFEVAIEKAADLGKYLKQLKHWFHVHKALYGLTINTAKKI